RGFQEETAGTPLRQAAVQAQRRLRVREHGRVDGDDPAVATAAGELVLRRGEPHASSRPVKHVAVPVWHAAPVWSTTYSSVSPSQSVATERTCCACPEVSPLTQISPRDRDQYVARPVSSVRRTASAFAHASMSTSRVVASWTTTGRSPRSSK